MVNELRFKLSTKQLEAWKYLTDNKTTEVLFGGAAGGGKSFLGCFWLVINCLKMPGSRWLMGRAVLKNLKESTLLTFFDVCQKMNLHKGKDYNFNSVESVIKFCNGSEVYLKDLFSYPSDPMFDSLGSTEFTGAFIDEASQITEKAFNIVMSRLRFKLEEFGTVPKLLTATNPCKNFLYSRFYKASIDKKLPEYRIYIPSLVQDNPFISPFYVQNLKKLDEVSKQRLLHGNWEYDDDPSKLFEYEDVINMFGNEGVERGEKYLSVDVARFGKDKTTMFFWNGFYIERIFYYLHSSVTDVIAFIKKVCAENHILRSHVVVDEDGVGGGVVDGLPGCKGFVNNSRAISKKKGYVPDSEKGMVIPNFKNLKTQCVFKASEMVSKGLIGCYSDIPVDIKQWFVEELEQIKRDRIYKDDTKLSLISKDVVKENLGRSPDFFDAFMMRFYFELVSDDSEFFFD